MLGNPFSQIPKYREIFQKTVHICNKYGFKKLCHLQLSAPQQPPTYDYILKYILINGLSKGQVNH